MRQSLIQAKTTRADVAVAGKAVCLYDWALLGIVLRKGGDQALKENLTDLPMRHSHGTTEE